MLLLILATFAAATRAACPVLTTAVELGASVDTVETAFSALDKNGVLVGAERIVDTLPCLGETLPTDLAARFHRARGLAFFLGKDPASARASFAASRTLEPAQALPERLAPAGNPIQTEFIAIRIDSLESASMPPGASRWAFDGRVSVPRPASVPTVLQVYTESGSVEGTWLLAPGDPLPESAFTPAPIVATTKAIPPTLPLTPDPDSTRREPSTALLVTAGGAFALSGILYGLGYKTQSDHASATDPDALDAAYRANHLCLYASGGAAVVAVGIGAGAFLVGRW